MQETTQLNVALVQADLVWRDPARNHAHLDALLASGAGDADIVVLPETFTTGFLGDAPDSGEGMDGPTVRWMRDCAARQGCTIVGSAVIAHDGGRVNRMLWVRPDGRLSHYDKRHLFSFAGEDRRYRAGAERVVFDDRGWRFCPQVCYDIRFPVWCRNRGDYDVLLVVANWPEPRIQSWSSLLRARAIENQAYVVAVNRVGEDGKGVRYNGRSVVCGPLGETLLELGAEEQVAMVSLDLDDVRAVRRDLPFHADADDFELKME